RGKNLNTAAYFIDYAATKFPEGAVRSFLKLDEWLKKPDVIEALRQIRAAQPPAPAPKPEESRLRPLEVPVRSVLMVHGTPWEGGTQKYADRTAVLVQPHLDEIEEDRPVAV